MMENKKPKVIMSKLFQMKLQKSFHKAQEAQEQPAGWTENKQTKNQDYHLNYVKSSFDSDDKGLKHCLSIEAQGSRRLLKQQNNYSNLMKNLKLTKRKQKNLGNSLLT